MKQMNVIRTFVYIRIVFFTRGGLRCVCERLPNIHECCSTVGWEKCSAHNLNHVERKSETLSAPGYDCFVLN